MNRTRLLALVVVAALANCSSASTPSSSLPSARSAGKIRTLSGGTSPIQHVVIIVQENRTTNNLFNGLPGAGTVREGKNSLGLTVQLQPRRLTAPYYIGHSHSNFVTEYANGRLDGFDLVASRCETGRKCPPPGIRAYGYVPQREVEPYFKMAQRYTFGANMFQTSQGPSFPAHQYLLSGTSTIFDGSSLRAAESPKTARLKNTGGCDSPRDSTVMLIDPYGNENQKTYPCFDRNSLIALIDAKSLTWHYYQAGKGPGLWHAPDAILPIFNRADFAANVVGPPARVLWDIKKGRLANVVWVTPTAADSDHAGSTDGTGPSWVASIVNTIGKSQYWTSTAIFVVWDDWGGWYDPAPPPQYNSYELGFRVPLLVISPYAKQNYVSTVQHEFGSILKFTEETFNLGSLGTTDVRADDLSDCFNFSKGPSKFVPIPALHDAQYFLSRPSSDEPPDDD
ncbi:MAG TPA: alkaline phosphatase family protein [Candidatus Binatia bacterium]|nr:alkaline phosphatase family protein [Candidatus Binatia bacterium]